MIAEFYNVANNCLLIFMWLSMSFIVGHILRKIVDLSKDLMTARWH